MPDSAQTDHDHETVYGSGKGAVPAWQTSETLFYGMD